MISKTAVCLLLLCLEQALSCGLGHEGPALFVWQRSPSELKRIKVPSETLYQVALIYAGYDNPREGYFCAGSLIAPEWVLTAAHCLSSRWGTSDFRVAAGSTQLSRSRLIAVATFTRHEQFDPNSMVNDIALIKLAERVDQATPINLANLELERLALEADGHAAVSGWGATGFHERTVSDELLTAIVPIRQRESCNKSYKGGVTEQMVCAGDRNADACVGDSGGGLVISYKGQDYLEGIVSWGEGCGNQKKPGVYTRVPSYLDWIKAHMN